MIAFYLAAKLTRAKSLGGIPTENVARHYRRLAKGGTGLIVTEGTLFRTPERATIGTRRESTAKTH